MSALTLLLLPHSSQLENCSVTWRPALYFAVDTGGRVAAFDSVYNTEFQFLLWPRQQVITVTNSEHDGVSQAIIREFVEHELPLIERTLAEVQAGKILSQSEVEMLTHNLEKAKDWHRVSWEVPKSRELLAKVIHSYSEIASLALENEAKGGR